MLLHTFPILINPSFIQNAKWRFKKKYPDNPGTIIYQYLQQLFSFELVQSAHVRRSFQQDWQFSPLHEVVFNMDRIVPKEDTQKILKKLKSKPENKVSLSLLANFTIFYSIHSLALIVLKKILHGRVLHLAFLFVSLVLVLKED